VAPHTVEEYLVNELVKDSANYELIRNYLEKLDKQQIVRLFDRFLESSEAEVRIPLSVLQNRQLSSLESMVKFLRENLGLSNAIVADLLGRSVQVCWTTYHNACAKLAARLDATPSRFDIPVSVIRGKLSVLESIVVHLKTQNLSYHEIALLLNRDDRTVWTVYNRALHKRASWQQ
jgi:DNA-directed RNA polymerase specialized sigma24 family protein